MNRSQYHRLRERRNRHILFIMLMCLIEEVNRQYWVHPINLLREQKGEFYQLYPDLRHFRKRFLSNYQMDIEKFEQLLIKVSPRLNKKWTYMRKPISSKQKLVITLRYVNTANNSLKSLYLHSFCLLVFYK